MSRRTAVGGNHPMALNRDAALVVNGIRELLGDSRDERSHPPGKFPVPGQVFRNCLFGTVDMGSRLTEPNVCTTLPARITDGLTLSNDPADISGISGLTRLFSNGNFHSYIVGTWRSLVSALAWGARGRRFKSSRPDHDRKNPREVQSPFGNGGAFFSQLRQPGVGMPPLSIVQGLDGVMRSRVQDNTYKHP